VDIPQVALAWLSFVPNRTGQVTRSEHTNKHFSVFQQIPSLDLSEEEGKKVRKGRKRSLTL